MTTQPSTQGSQSVTVGQVFSALRRRISTVVLTALIGGLLAFLYGSTLAAPMYSATAVASRRPMPLMEAGNQVANTCSAEPKNTSPTLSSACSARAALT